jgi:hypothetical protein
MCHARGYYHKVEYENVLRTFQKNTTVAKDTGAFNSLMVSALENYVRAGGTWFRYHSYGDFFSQTYIDNVFDIAGVFPQVKFLAHTKSYMFD